MGVEDNYYFIFSVGGGGGHELKPGPIGRVNILFYPGHELKPDPRLEGQHIILSSVGGHIIKSQNLLGDGGCRFHFFFQNVVGLLEDFRSLVTLIYTCVISMVSTSYFINFIGCNFSPSTILSFHKKIC